MDTAEQKRDRLDSKREQTNRDGFLLFMNIKGEITQNWMSANFYIYVLKYNMYSHAKCS